MNKAGSSSEILTDNISLPANDHRYANGRRSKSPRRPMTTTQQKLMEMKEKEHLFKMESLKREREHEEILFQEKLLILKLKREKLEKEINAK